MSTQADWDALVKWTLESGVGAPPEPDPVKLKFKMLSIKHARDAGMTLTDIMQLGKSATCAKYQRDNREGKEPYTQVRHDVPLSCRDSYILQRERFAEITGHRSSEAWFDFLSTTVEGMSDGQLKRAVDGEGD